MEQPKSTNAGGSTILSGQTATERSGGPVLHTEQLKLVPIRLCDYEPYRAFIMPDRARYIGGPFEDEGKAWRTFVSMIGHWHIRGFGLFSVITCANDQLVGVFCNWWPLDFPEREIG